jgi:crotonobetainyl-CoA:carnitine CoA-transferase CaiB-like acyl-CoA transferase
MSGELGADASPWTFATPSEAEPAGHDAGAAAGSAAESATRNGGPLAGIRVVELASVVAGPSVGKHLGDFGAEVIKVERSGDGDPTRGMGELLGRSRSAWWLLVGRNKRSVTLDLKHPLGREAFLRLIGTADVLVESQRPGVLERLDLAPDTLWQTNPKLIIVRISGFGQTGPYRLRPGFGTLAEAFSGLASITGETEGPPMLAPIALADEVSGLYGAWAVTMALYHRDARSGRGQVIDISLYEALLSIIGPLPALYRKTGYVQGRVGSRLPWSAPRNLYPSSDGAYFVVSGSTPGPAQTIIRVIGGEGLVSDARFATAEARSRNADELDALVAAWIGARTADEVERVFREEGIAGIRVLEVPEIFTDEHYAARASIVEVPDAELGSVALQAPVPRLSETPGAIKHPGPELGRDTAGLVAELDFTAEELELGRAKGVW